jgi:aryl-alcohol dehydrogenase-like predicted oxidoreductase
MDVKLNEYVTLGRSGLRVSPLCLGTMTFGTIWGWGADEATARAMFNHYIGQGGNFVDTADGYTNGISEEMVGKFMAEGKVRDRIVLATKFTFNMEPGNPNAGGNGRKNIYRALEASLKRLGTDYVDLYWMHAWDMMTPAEEVLSTLDALVREGKVRYVGFSDIPAWYAARAQTIAEFKGWERVVAFQLEYSLVERSIEREHIPVARELGIGLCPWSPLAGGFLSGKYRSGEAGNSRGRLDAIAGTGMDRFRTERNEQVLGTLLEVAQEIGRPPAEVALNWVTAQPGVTSTIIGVTKPEQLASNLAALDFTLPSELHQKLDAASALPLIHPYRFFQEETQGRIRGGVKVRPWSG